MKLADYLEVADVTLATFAEQIGVAGAPVVHRYASNQRIPRPAIMARITAATKGAVTANDFFPAEPAVTAQ